MVVAGIALLSIPVAVIVAGLCLSGLGLYRDDRS